MDRINTKQEHLFLVVNSIMEKHGSMEDFYLSVARECRRIGWAMTILVPCIRASAVREELESEGARIICVGEEWDRPGSRRRVLAAKVRELRPTIVNFHFCGSCDFIPVFIQCRRVGAKVIWHFHGEIHPLQRLPQLRKHFSSLRLMSLFIDLIVPVSGANEQYLRALKAVCRTRMIYNGIDTNRIAWPGPRRERNDGEVKILYLGSLIPRKRVDVLLRAFRQLLEQLPTCRLIIAGGGELEKDLRAVSASLSLDDRVEFLGLLQEPPYRLFSICDIFASASTSESFGLVFAEAMFFGLPVVACRVGGIPEVVSDGATGLLVAPENASELADAMFRLARDRDGRRKMGELGRERVRSHFRLDERINELFATYKQVRTGDGS